MIPLHQVVGGVHGGRMQTWIQVSPSQFPPVRDLIRRLKRMMVQNKAGRNHLGQKNLVVLRTLGLKVKRAWVGAVR